MALSQQKLEDGLITVFRTPRRSALEAAKAMAQAFQAYADDAEAGAGDPTFDGDEIEALRDAIRDNAKEPEKGTARRYATAWRDGVLGFWTNTVFSDATSSDTPAEGAGTGTTLISTIETFSEGPRDNPFEVAADLADALHTYTTQFQVTLDSGTNTLS